MGAPGSALEPFENRRAKLAQRQPEEHVDVAHGERALGILQDLRHRRDHLQGAGGEVDLGGEGVFVDRLATTLGKGGGVLEEGVDRSEEHTSELQSLMRISYAVFCLKKKKNNTTKRT